MSAKSEVKLEFQNESRIKTFHNILEEKLSVCYFNEACHIFTKAGSNEKCRISKGI